MTQDVEADRDKLAPPIGSPLRQIVHFHFQDDGSGEFEFWFGARKCRMRLACLHDMAAEISGAADEYISVVNCAAAVGPLLEAMASDGWVIAPPAASRPTPDARNTSGGK